VSLPHPDQIALDAFVWASGIEDTFVPQTRPGQRALDEYELMGHYEHWRADLALVRDLGLQALRWGVPWYKVEPQPGQFDWRWTDEVLPYLVEELGIAPIVDLMHYGCPFWLRREFANERYPQAVAAYAHAFAERYKSLVQWYTPLNEPIVNALQCGMHAAWPPYLRGERGYIQVMLQIAKGIVRSVEAIRGADPQAVIAHVEATGLSRSARQDLAPLAVEEQRRGYLCFDLLTGRVTPEHPLFPWLVRNGATPDDLAWLAGQATPIDVMGMNFYPQWSTRQLTTDKRGRLAFQIVEDNGAGFAELIEDYYRRYRRPIMITETSAVGLDSVRSAWLEASLAAIKGLRARGIPVIGYTWFPLFTMVDWRYRTGSEPLTSYYLELGLYSLGRNEGPRWRPSALVEQFRRYVERSGEAVGSLHPTQIEDSR
jgi:beta-glucosidase/6-phospho-beta-glucosidase/beta-galactosidase